MLTLRGWTLAQRSLLIIASLCWGVSMPGEYAVAQTGGAATGEIAWPAVARSARPWTRWWWHGSAVNEADVSRLLETYQQAGLGGVEITCIYGVKGNGANNRDYMSDGWVAALQHAIGEANRLDMGVDLPAGSGWRMGGPFMTSEYANSEVVIESTKVAAGATFSKKFDRSTPEVAVAIDAEGNSTDLSDRIANGQVEWQAAGEDVTIYTLARKWSGDKVKRPGPGGGGLNINPYWQPSVDFFLDHFGVVLDRLPGIRAQFHDSFEYEGNWQPEFLDEFATRRGYRLEQYLPALAGDGDADLVARVKSDYRETLSDLVLDDFIKPWVEWSHKHGQLARNQSHGSPANWLDLYSACDIPEIESFGRLADGDGKRLVLKFPSAAANVQGKRLVSSETATWLDEHFTVTLSQIKQIVDRQMLAGVNHMFYHGAAYSPADAKWPGWLFYASTQMNPQNPIWHDVPALNHYVTRCQSVLQAATADNDILLYWPIYDTWHEPRGLRMNFRVHDASHWLFGTPFGDAAQQLDDASYQFDYVSDRGLANCEVGGYDGALTAPGGKYRTIVVPNATYMPVATVEKLAELATGGVTIVFWDKLPESEPGLAGMQSSERWRQVMERMQGLRTTGQVVVADDVLEAVAATASRREDALRECGISFLRKTWGGQPVYLLHNGGEAEIDDWVTLGETVQSAAILDPMTGGIAQAATRNNDDGRTAMRLQLLPGQTLFAKAIDHSPDLPTWAYREPAGEETTLDGKWLVEFVEGGPNLPEAFETASPQPWTEAPDESAQAFAGTVRYTTKFVPPSSDMARWQLDLGEVLGSARVRVNGEELGTLIAAPYVVDVAGLESGKNTLTVEVTGVAANRIRDLDRRGVEWRIFDDINLVNINYRPFDASRWPVRPLGLNGPVTLTPLKAASE